MDNIPFIDLKTQYNKIKEIVDKSIIEVLESGQFILGNKVTELEEKLSQYASVKNTITCASGTDALVMALMALETKPNDAVIVPSFTFVASGESVVLAGAQPIFVDVDEKTFNITEDAIKKGIETAKQNNLNPAGIIAVDLFGQPAEYDIINAIAKENGMWVIADSAQGFGATYKNKKTGSLADITTTSFYPAKPFGAYGDGGAIFTDNDNLAEKLKSIRVHGYDHQDKYNNIRIGINGRMDTIQAAVMLEKLKIFDAEIKSRQTVADTYSNELKDILDTPYIEEHNQSVWAQYTIKIDADKREELKAKLSEKNIPTACFYPKPIHMQTAYKNFLTAGELSLSESLAKQVLSLPMHPYLEQDILEYIITHIKEAV